MATRTVQRRASRTRSPRSAAGKRPSRSKSAATRRPSTRRTNQKATASHKTARRSARPATRRSRRASARDEPLEFVELPVSGSAGSSWEPDSYTPKADLMPREPNEGKASKGFFSGLFRNR
jgi:alkanesulfonate monooxygenase SsuD/methylene tetrahydromethanopterin reductase-like flavin-dependent oxidoreductase (luciferase family)